MTLARSRMSREDEEFKEADAILQDALPRLAIGAPLSVIRALVLPPAIPSREEAAAEPIPSAHLPLSSYMVWQGETLFQVNRLLLTPDTPPLVAFASGISRKDFGSGGKCWDGSLALARWIAYRAAAGESPVAGKRVLELGAGCSGLPGIVACRDGDAASVVVTEAPIELAAMLRRSVALNVVGHPTSARISVRRLVWRAPGSGRENESVGSGAGVDNTKGRSVVETSSATINDTRYDGLQSVKAWKSSVAEIDLPSIPADVILAAEPIWAGCDPMPLVHTIKRCLLHGRGEHFQVHRPSEHMEQGNNFSEGGYGVCFIVMPEGGRGAEDELKAAGTEVGLRWSVTPLPVAKPLPRPAATSTGKGAFEACCDTPGEAFWLYEARLNGL